MRRGAGCGIWARREQMITESGSQLHAITTTRQAWDPVIATRGKHPRALPAAA